jgi:hypothetical protein
MKLIATRSFSNVKSLGLTVDPKAPGFKDPLEVHKGYRFTIGTSEDYDGLTPEQKRIVQQLVGHKAAIYDNDLNKIKVQRLLDEVAAEQKQEAAIAAKRNAGSLESVVAAAVKAALGK